MHTSEVMLDIVKFPSRGYIICTGAFRKPAYPVRFGQANGPCILKESADPAVFLLPDGRQLKTVKE